MNDQFFEVEAVNDYFNDSASEKYDVTEAIQQRAKSAKVFSLVAMIVSCALFLLLVGTFAFAMVFPSMGIFAILTLPFSITTAVLEVILMIGAIVLNIIALVNTIKQQKEFKLYLDGPEKDALQATVNISKIFTFIGVGVAALALILILPLNILEFVLSIA